MIKTRVQIPDPLRGEAKPIAKEYEMRASEVVRKGLERLAPGYPSRNNEKDWNTPSPRRPGCRDLSPEQLQDIARGLDEVPEWMRP